AVQSDCRRAGIRWRRRKPISDRAGCDTYSRCRVAECYSLHGAGAPPVIGAVTAGGAMRMILLSLMFVATSLGLLLQAGPVYAQASRTWVSGVGDDANPCSRTAPCKTFAGAIAKTALNGEINCLDPGGFGAVTITKSITIDCHEVFASILNALTNGVNIPFDSFAASDTQKKVRLRNINFNGVATGLVGISITGGGVIAGGAVFIEDCLLDGNFGVSARGVSDTR